MLDGITGRSPQAEVQLPSSPGGFGRSAWKIPEVKIKSKPLESQSSSSFLSPPLPLQYLSLIEQPPCVMLKLPH